VEAALQLVAEKGVQGLTLREAARRVGVSQAAPYRHFADKKELLLAVGEAGFRAMHEDILKEVAKAPTAPPARLSAIGVAYVRFAAERPALFRVMFGQELARADGSPSAEQSAMMVFQELVAEILRGQGSGDFRSDDPLGLAVGCWSIAHGLAVIFVEGLLERRQLAPAAASTPEPLTRMVTQLLIDGLAKR
jgi:AcrR family transcriptional regulator